MTIWVDHARWEWRGRRWAHLVSDESYDQLHDFARLLGKRRLGFQGDHYDIDAQDQRRAVDLGARVIESRELVRRLRASGLRNRLDKPIWKRVTAWPVGTEITGLEPRLAELVGSLGLDTAVTEAGLYRDPRQAVVLLDLPPGTEIGQHHSAAWIGEPRLDGWRSIEIFVSR